MSDLDVLEVLTTVERLSQELAGAPAGQRVHAHSVMCTLIQDLETEAQSRDMEGYTVENLG